MKVDYANTDGASGHELLQIAKSAEKDDDLQVAAATYKKLIKMHYRREIAYQRLMVIYRKQGDLKKEMDIIKEAIDEFSKILFVSKRLHSKKVEKLSRGLIHSTGLGGKGAIHLHKPEPIAGWEIRRQRLEKKLKAG